MARAMLDRTYFMPVAAQSTAYTSAQRAALTDVLTAVGAAIGAVAPIATAPIAPTGFAGPQAVQVAAAARRQVEAHLAALDEHRARLAEQLAVDPTVDQAAWS